MQQVILVIEQDETLREMIARSLRVGGYLVLEVADGTTALETARDNSISLVLLDPLSLRSAGLEVCRKLRQRPETATIPIVVLVTGEAEIDRIERAGFFADDYLVKPLQWGEVRPRVRAILRRGRRVQKTLLVAAHDAAMRDAVADELRAAGYLVLTASDGPSTIEAARGNPVSLIVLDPTSLQPGGLETCRELRESPETARVPVLLLVNDVLEITRVEWEGPRANDYIVKPIVREELHACVQALLRGDKRGKVGKSAQKARTRRSNEVEGQAIASDPLRVDMSQHQVIRGDQQISLGNTLLFDLLVYLVRHPGVALSREQLLRDVWGGESSTDTRTVDVHIHWLRQKLQKSISQQQVIRTVPGVGYCFRGEGDIV